MRLGWCLLVLGALACAPKVPPPDDLGALQHFEGFEDAQGQPIGASSLAGRPWVANFMFTSCPASCPPLARASADLQKRILAQFPDAKTRPAIVTVTVDPVTDTPERLTKFGQEYGADPAVWRFARADYPKMERLVTEGFYMPLLRTDASRAESVEARDAALTKPTPLDTAHSLQFVLVDAQGHLRGVFGREPKELERLEATLHALSGP
jgi:protein SCO1/2